IRQTLCHTPLVSASATAANGVTDWRKSPEMRAARDVEPCLQPPDRILNLLRERLIVVASEGHRGAERDAHASRLGHPPRMMEDFVESFDANRHDRHAEPRRDHPDARTEAFDLARVAALALGEDQDRESVLEHVADVAQRLPR